jgi:uncharacterized membrane protein YeaQ/YmgE (transglycosylase-associated protein family)
MAAPIGRQAASTHALIPISISSHASSIMPLWLHWIILGLVAGALAKFIMPGRDPAGCLVTIALGVAGAFIGGWAGIVLGWGRISQTRFDLRSVGLATLGAIVLLTAGRIVVRRR